MKRKTWMTGTALMLLMMMLTTVTAGAHNLGTSGEVSGNTATYTITGTEGNYTLTISPKSGTGAIDGYSFYNSTTDLSGIKTVIIEEGITSIGEYAFGTKGGNKAEFTSLSIPASVTSIGKAAFNECHSLATVTIASGSQLQTIGYDAFKDCYFNSIILPCAGLTSIGNGAFNRTSGYQNLSEIVCLTEAALSVQQYVFYNNSNQVTVYMLGSHKVGWNDAKAVKGLVTSVVAGTGVSSLTADYSGATTKTAGSTTYYVGGSTVKLTLSTSLTGDDVVFRANGVDLVKGSDDKYTLTLPDDATVVTVTASLPQSISGATVTLAETSYTYDGTAKTPAVSSVTLGGTTLEAGTDYVVSYSDNTLPGTATVTVTGKGNYCGTATAHFSIVGPAISGLTYNSTDYCYDIGTPTELQAFMTYANNVSGTTKCQGLTFRLTADIDMTGQAYTPVGNFKGTFNGNSRTITGLSGSNGLFAIVGIGGMVTGLTLSDVNISGSKRVGAVAGISLGVIENCHVTGSVSGTFEVGGIVGYEHLNSTIATTNPLISNCMFSGTVTGTGQKVGGIAGCTIRPIQHCTVSGSTITGDALVGGIVGNYWIGDCAVYDLSNCTVAGVTLVSNHDTGKIYGYIDPSDLAAHPDFAHDNTVYYGVTCGTGVTATYASGTKTTIGGVDYYLPDATLTLSASRTGYVFKGYTVTDESNSDVTSTALSGTTLTLPASDVSVTAQWYDLALFGYNDDPLVDGSAEHPFVISTAEGWNLLCDALQDNDTWNRFSGKTVKLGANIEVSRMAGGSHHDFTGTFDGDGYTLTLDYGTADSPIDAQFVAPFPNTEDSGDSHPTFRNLTIDGHIYEAYTGSDAHNVGGLIGHLYGTVTIEHCTSNVTITSTGGAGGFVGLCERTVSFTDCVSGTVVHSAGGNNSGFVGWSRSSNYAINFTGCLFNGKLLQIDGSGSYNGGFIGWKGDAKKVNITNCLVAPAALADGETMADGGSATFSREHANYAATITNSYYTRALGTAQGLGYNFDTAPANIGTAGTAYGVSGITPYTRGIGYAGRYYMTPEAVSLSDNTENDVDGIGGYFADVTLDGRTLYKDGTWNTLCLPFALSASEIAAHADFAGATLMEVDVTGKNGFDPSHEKLYLTFKEATAIAAGVPYLVKWDEGADFTSPLFLGVTIDAEASTTMSTASKGLQQVQMVGTYSPVAVVADDQSTLLLSDDNTLYHPTADCDIRSCRAYFSVPYIKQNAGATVRTFRLDFGEGFVPTGISLTPASPKDSEGSSHWYTLDGRRLEGMPSARGVYVNNGRKIVVR